MPMKRDNEVDRLFFRTFFGKLSHVDGRAIDYDHIFLFFLSVHFKRVNYAIEYFDRW